MPANAMSDRLPALDWMRGIVMLIMVTDHASSAYNAGHLANDSAFQYDPSVPLPTLAFLYRWMSHLCAPTFLFLAGTALALSIARKRARGVSERRIDRDLLVRGAIIVALEVVFINLFWTPGLLLLQVLYAIGLSMILMIPLRRVPTAWLVGAAVAILIANEFMLKVTYAWAPESLRPVFVLLFVLGLFGDVLVAYPVLPWLAMMMLGWGFGRYLSGEATQSDNQRSPIAVLVILGALALGAFVALRAANDFGNMRLLRYGDSLVQWLHTSKYPPSLTFALCELGLMALILAACFAIQNRRAGQIAEGNPLLVFGQTALFFYLAHILILETSARALSMYHARGLTAAILASVLVIIVLYPLCVAYRRYKANHRDSWVRFI